MKLAEVAWLQLIQFADRKDLPVGKEQLIISIQQQKLYLYQKGLCTQQYPVSTSKYGQGQQSGSYQTPIGVHCISEKIGAGAPINSIFKARQLTGQCAVINTSKVDSENQPDVITSRIMWLKGIEPGLNAGGVVDSKQRYIYIHGTADEAQIGTPASIGCIRMLNKDVINLFEQANEGTLVNIF